MNAESSTFDTFPKLLLRNAEAYATRPAIREKRRGIWHSVTWYELALEVASLAVALQKHELKRGSHVAFIGDNRPRLFAGICAAQALGAVAMPLYQDAPGDELVPLIQKAAPTHIFAENQEQIDKLMAILPQCPSIRFVIYDDDRGMRHYKQPELISYATLLEQGKGTTFDYLKREAQQGSSEDIAFLFFSSGATGKAKGVCLTHNALIDRAKAAAKAEKLTENDVTMAYLPPGWIGQTLFSYIQPMTIGYCVCCPESSDTLLSDLREIAPSCLLTTPRVLDTIASQVTMRIEDAGGLNASLYRRAMKRSLGSGKVTGLAGWFYNTTLFRPLRDTLGMTNIRVAYSAGDAIDPAILRFFQAVGINLKQLYGSTETGYFTALHRDGEVKSDTVGPPAEGVELSFSEDREILVRSPGLFREYLGGPERTAQAKTSDGWFHTGDIGYLGDDGQLRIVDRATDIGTLTDGTAFIPRPIENKLKFNAYIREAVVLGDGRDTICAMIDIETAAVGQWADSHEITYTGHADLASQDAVGKLIGDCIAEINYDLSSDPETADALIHRFVLLPSELSANDSVLTRTGRIKRGAIMEQFGALIDALYGDKTTFRFEATGSETTLVGLHNAIAPAKIAPRRVA